MVKQMKAMLHAGGSPVLFMIALAASVQAEPIVLPPVWSEAHYVQQLMAPEIHYRHLLEAHVLLRAHTNVRPLADNTQKIEQFAGSSGYYRFTALHETQVNVGRWALRYAFGVADRYEGNAGAAQLFLYGDNLIGSPPADQAVHATLNRSAINRWTIEYRVPLSNRYGGGVVIGAGSLYLTRRIQQGWLQGMWQNGVFDGNLVLDSTRGLDPWETRSVGTGLHLALSLPLSHRWRLGFWGENLLGHVWQRKIQRIAARVRANSIVPDADGFLHAAPLLSGTVSELSPDLLLQKRIAFGLAHQQPGGAWLAFATHDEEWRFAVGRTLPRGWVLWHLPEGELQVAWGTARWQFLIGLAHLDPTQSRHFTLNVRWYLPLSR